MKFLKKSLSLILALCMILSYVPTNVFAATGTNDSFGAADGFYKIVHLDAGRKYISVDNIKKYIDAMADVGYNQLTLYFSDNQGFRFKLDDMTLTVDGTDYTAGITAAIGNGYNQPATGTGTGDWFRHSLEADGTKNYLNEEDMETIITYANSKGIDLVPAFDMPGHMGAILEEFTNFRYTGSSSTSWSTLNVDDEAARKFALALLQKYVDYFADLGCDYFSICADEFCYDTGAGNIKTETLANIMLFMDEAAKIIDDAGMIPRCFNDWLYSSTAYTPSEAYGKYEVYYWGNRGYATPNDLYTKGHKIINTGEMAYYALGSEYYSESVTDSGVKAFDPYVISTKSGSFDISDPAGVCFAIWCDRGYFDTNTANTGAANEPEGGDGGTILFSETEGYLRIFAESVDARGPQEETINLTVGQETTVTFGPYEGELSASDISTKLGLNGVLTASSISVTPGTSGGGTTQLSSWSGVSGTVAVGNGSDKWLKYENGSFSVVSTAAAATQWIVDDNGSNFGLRISGTTADYLAITDGGLAIATRVYGSDSLVLDGSLLKNAQWPNKYVSLASGATSSATSAGIGIYGVTAGTSATTSFKLTGASVGTVSFNGTDGTKYTINVTSNEHTHDSNVPATCQKGASCSVCGAEQDTAKNENNHVGTLSGANCATLGTYSGCGHTGGTTNPSVHTGETYVSGRVEATETTEGYTGDTYCSGCDAKLEDGEVIPVVHNHTGGVANCTTPATCTACGESYGNVDLNNHVGDRKVTGITATFSGNIICVACGNQVEAGTAIENDPNAIYISVTANGTATYTVNSALGTNGATGKTTNELASYSVAITETTVSSGASISAWESGKSYAQGDLVEYNDTIYYRYYQGSDGTPGSSNAWKTVETWSAKGYEGNTVVVYNGEYYKASGWANESAVPGTAAIWVKLDVGSDDSGTSETVTKTTITFTAGATNGNDEVTIGGQKFIVTVTGGNDPIIPGVTCEHTWEQKFDADGHWNYCEKCGSSTTKASHSGGTATCKEQAVCSTCNQKYGALADHTGGTTNCVEKAVCTVCSTAYGDVDADNHKGPEVTTGYQAPTDTETGYTGDVYCDACDELIRNGTEIPTVGTVTETIEVVSGTSEKPDGTEAVVKLEGHKGTVGEGSTNNGLANYTIAHTTGSVEENPADWEAKQYEPGALVTWEGKIYEAKRWTGSSENPSDTSAWTYVRDAAEGPMTVITFTGGANHGTDKVTIGDVTIGVTVICAHNWETKFDTDNHWSECSKCHETKDETAHSGGTATCEDYAQCATCGQAYGALADHRGGTANCQTGAACATCGTVYTDVNPKNHVGPMVEVEGTYVAPGDETDGKEADKKCSACEAVVTGGVIPSLNSNIVVITVATNQSVTKFRDGEDLRDWSDSTGSNPNTGIATVGITYNPADPGGNTSHMTSWSGNATVVIGNGTDKWLKCENGVFSVVSTAAEATQWTLEDNQGSNFGLKHPDGSGYLHLGTNGGGTTVSIGERVYGGNDSLKIENGYLKDYGYPNMFLNLDSSVVGSTSSAGIGVYSITTPTAQNSTITFTGVTPGTTYALIGGTRYQINVVDAALMDAVLATPTWMTNRKVSGFIDEDGASVDFNDTISAADHVAIVSADGVALSDVIPPEATKVNEADTDSNAIFWRGMLHNSSQIQGTVADFHRHGQVINYVRYDKDAGIWYGSTDRKTWVDMTGYTLDIYYLQETAVTKEVITEVVDWGEDYNNGLAWEASTYVLLDFAVAMDGVGRHPVLTDPDGVVWPNNGDGSTVENQKTIAFHCTTTTDEKVTSVDGYAQRRIDTIFAHETSQYEVYMITLIRTDDNPANILPGGNSNECGKYSYTGEEKIVWTKDEQTFQEKVGQTTTDGKVLGAFDPRPADFDILTDSKATVYRTSGGDPIVDYVQIYRNQGLLVTYYVRAKETEDSLKVHYRMEGATEDFYNYNIAVKEGTYFDDNFGSDPSANIGLVNNSVQNYYNNTHTVPSNLTELMGIPTQYRTNGYEFTEHVRLVLDDGTEIDQNETIPEGRKVKEVILYYQLDNIHYVPVDFGRPMVFDASFFYHQVPAEDFTIDGVSLVYSNMVGPIGNYGHFTVGTNVYTYVPDYVMLNPEKLFEFKLSLTPTDGTAAFVESHFVQLLPATTVYYEDIFFSNVNGWSLSQATGALTNGRPSTAQQVLCTNDTAEANVYGYDAADSTIVGPSNGTHLVSTAVGNSMTVTFKGTGIDIYANCATEAGQVMVIVRDTEGSLVKMISVDTRILSGDTQNATVYNFTSSYNIPIVAIRDLEHGTYNVEIRHVKQRNVTLYPVSIDGFRVYNTLESDDAVHADVTAGDIYYKHYEKNPTFVELRDIALVNIYSKSDYEAGEFEDRIYADQIASNTMSQVYASGASVISGVVISKTNEIVNVTDSAVKADIINNGPKNEIYLFPGQSLIIATDLSSYYQIGLKAVDAAVSYKINNGTAQTLGTSTDMFYRVQQSFAADNQSATLTITNSGTSGVLSITKLKMIDSNQYTQQGTYQPNLTLAALTDALIDLGYEKSEPAADQIGFAGTNMTLGNELAMNFWVNASDLEGTGYYAEIVKKYADREDVKVQIPFENWIFSEAQNMYYFSFNGIAAKEMTDDLYVTVYAADGTQVSETKVDSIEAYVLRSIDGWSDEMVTLAVDMLNYGAAAQEYFGYNVENLANAEIDAYQSKATQSAEATDSRVVGENYVGSTLTLESNIVLSLYFKNLTRDMKAVVTFADHYGNEKTVTVDGADFDKLGDYLGVVVDELVIADASQLVTCVIYDADGNEVASVSDSIESYIARMSTEDALFEQIMKFSASAYAYFH